MNKLSILFLTTALLCHLSFAQERRGGGKQRAGYAYGKGEIKIAKPAEWIKNLENPVFSGPQPGEKAPTFAATNLRSEEAGAELDPIALAEGKLHLMIFSSKSRTFGRFLGQLRGQLQTIEEKSGQAWAMSLTVCTDDANEAVTSFAVLDRRYPKNLLVGLSNDGSDGPPAYGLDRNLTATVIVTKNGKVTHNLPYAGDAFYSQPHILGAIAEAMEVDHDTLRKWIGETPGDAAGSAARRARRNAQPNANADRPAPKQGFRKLLAPLVQGGTLSRADAGELFRASGDATTLRTKIRELATDGKLTRRQARDLMLGAYPEEAKHR